MNKGLKYLAIFLSLCFSARSINSPEIRCVLVLSNGQVTLTWQIPADPFNEFSSYEIYACNTLNGLYANVGTIASLATNSYTYPVSVANTGPYFFYVHVKNKLAIEEPAIDTVKTMYLSFSSTNAGVANLQWNDFHFPLPAGESSSYKVYREYPINTWTQIATVPVHNTPAYYYYSDTIALCSDSLNYRIELYDPVLLCTSVSNILGGKFVDATSPFAPSLDSVSVNSSGQVIMGLHPSYSNDAKCFVIYLWTGVWIAIDTVCTNNLATVYTYTASNANNVSELFSVAAIDSCNNISAIAANQQATMHLTGTYDVCGNSASLTWNAYQNMRGGVDHYDILCSVNAGPFTFVGDTNTTVYSHKGLIQGNNYCYLIRAHSILKKLNMQDSITSTSNKYCVTPSVTNKPLYVYLNDVTVNNPAEIINIKWFVDKNVRVGGFNIYRSTNYSGGYGKIGFANYTGQSNYSITDNNVNVRSQKYFYYVVVLDTCMNPSLQTDTSNSILLSAVASGDFSATLYWNNYSKWLGNVSGYNIYRSMDGVFVGPIATVSAGTNSYVDDLSNFTTYTGKFSYYVEAIEGAGNTYGFAELSASNYADVYIDAAMYIPNAFVPKGRNKIFIPVGDYIEKTDYKFSIFDRWGQKIFETTDETTGWDGGHFEAGLYAYKVEYKTAIGEYKEKNGTVTLIR